MISHDTNQWFAVGLMCTALLGPLSVGATEFSADPSNYRAVLSKLRAGDTMVLAPGTYTGGDRKSHV